MSINQNVICDVLEKYSCTKGSLLSIGDIVKYLHSLIECQNRLSDCCETASGSEEIKTLRVGSVLYLTNNGNTPVAVTRPDPLPNNIDTWMNGTKQDQIFHNGSRITEMYMNGVLVFFKELVLELPQYTTEIDLREFINSNNPDNIPRVIVYNYLTQPKLSSGDMSGLDVTLINNGEFQGFSSSGDAISITTPLKLINNGWIRGAGGDGGDGINGDNTYRIENRTFDTQIDGDSGCQFVVANTHYGWIGQGEVDVEVTIRRSALEANHNVYFLKNTDMYRGSLFPPASQSGRIVFRLNDLNCPNVSFVDSSSDDDCVALFGSFRVTRGPLKSVQTSAYRKAYHLKIDYQVKVLNSAGTPGTPFNIPNQIGNWQHRSEYDDGGPYNDNVKSTRWDSSHFYNRFWKESGGVNSGAWMSKSGYPLDQEYFNTATAPYWGNQGRCHFNTSGVYMTKRLHDLNIAVGTTPIYNPGRPGLGGKGQGFGVAANSGRQTGIDGYFSGPISGFDLTTGLNLDLPPAGAIPHGDGGVGGTWAVAGTDGSVGGTAGKPAGRAIVGSSNLIAGSVTGNVNGVIV